MAHQRSQRLHSSPSPSAQEDQKPTNIWEHIKELGRAARAFGELFEDHDQVTIGEIKRRCGRLLRLLGLT